MSFELYYPHPLHIKIAPLYGTQKVKLAALAGFEPTLSEPKSDVLPLHQSAVLQDSGGYRLHNTRPKFCLRRNEILKPLASSRQNGVV